MLLHHPHHASSTGPDATQPLPSTAPRPAARTPPPSPPRAPSPPSYSAPGALDEVARLLPPGWEVRIDKATDRLFYVSVRALA